MIPFRLAITAVLMTLAWPAIAQIPPPGGVAPGFSPAPVAPIQTSPGVATARGTGLISGSPGSPQTVVIPGSAVPGLLLNNGNGTSTIMVPGSPSEVVPTPR